MNHFRIALETLWRKIWAGLVLMSLAVFLLWPGLGAEASSPRQDNPGKAGAWRGVHLMLPPASKLALLKRAIAEALAPMGINVIVLEVDYNFAWETHPDLRGGSAISKAQAQDLTKLCRAHSIRLIPLFNCLGHQSWAKNTLPLLVKHPEFDETPQIPLDNPGIYCRSWCPLHPAVNKVIFALMDELLDAFQADALHVGMDEVFLIGHEQCSRCRGQDPGKLFAKAVNDYYQHLVKEKQATMLMWGDRLLDDAVMKYGKWEASQNGTAPAIDLIPKDIIMCDWHYGKRDAYPSVPYFQKHGFRVWPSSWRNQEAALALLKFSRQNATDKMLGHLCTTWTSSEQISRLLLGEDEASLAKTKDIVEALRSCMKEMSAAQESQK
jgi:hypothetical protein